MATVDPGVISVVDVLLRVRAKPRLDNNETILNGYHIIYSEKVV